MISDDDVVEQPATAPATPTTLDETPPPPVPGPRRSYGVLAVVLGVLLVAAVAIGVVQFQAAADAGDERDELAADQADDRDARFVAAQFAEAFFTYDYTDVDASRDAVLDLVTEEYAANFEANRLPGLTELFTNTQLTTTGAAEDVYLTTISDAAAKAVVVIDVTAAGDLEQRTLDNLTLLLQLRRESGEWKVDEVSLPRTQILGPDGQPIDGSAPATTATTATTAPPP